ncbi:GNAT family N-acetyltransferase [Neobacillus piezotolerans]|uniref:GNAT family N-acetyltransferase n=1 Tax=Neobacillus piezotolerans TaxID=2259171 RepID=A0A3D8GL01_9BACI|nr:GNAT family protein [Neobacillus piezotolerans]RDU34977.1 GNAT family N-acetyltransferase [Neobacillus piezotolerans]
MEIETVYADLPKLETERLILRKVTMNDAEDMFAYGSDEEVARYVTWDKHNTIEDTRSFIDFVLGKYENKQLAPWAIESKETGRMIGTIDFVSWQPRHNSAEIGYVIARDQWGKGITTEAASELIKFGFEHMELVRIQARCFIENIGSARVMEKVGMSFEGVNRKAAFIKGKHRDLKIYAILKEDFAYLQKKHMEEAV